VPGAVLRHDGHLPIREEAVMSRINWRDVFKFFSGATFVGTIANGVLFQQDISMSFWGFTISPRLFGVRAVLSFVLFCVFFYFGYLKRKDTAR
jgi:hypothetical protein